tara:strand:+ start:344 stop:598 length:255 start_codon:yes stop_codon:yes gene_type:complete
MATKLIIISTGEITEEMSANSDVYLVSPDESKTVLKVSENKPSCFEEYETISRREFLTISNNDASFWLPVPSWADDKFKEIIYD